MLKKMRSVLIFILAGLAFTACASQSNQARQALNKFFAELSAGRYGAAAQFYGGSYETLVGYNPGIDPDDQAALWRQGCEVNGLQCLPIRTVTFNELTAGGEYIFTVEFNAPGGDLFVLEACCGENPTTPPQFQFEYRVVRDGDGRFRVLDMPVYLP